MVYKCRYAVAQTYRMDETKSESNVNYGLWIITMCQCRCHPFIKCTVLLENADNMQVYAHMSMG
jgi:hypothetical protein